MNFKWATVFGTLSIVKGHAPSTESVTVYFIRHAHSTWNKATDILGQLKPGSSGSSSPTSPRTSRSSTISGTLGTVSKRFLNTSIGGGDSPPSSPSSAGSIRSRSGSTATSNNDSSAAGGSPILQFVGDVATAAARTFKGLTTGQFRDAPLSDEGITQAENLAKWLDEECPSNPDRGYLNVGEEIIRNEDACVLNRRKYLDNGSVLIASNLQRTQQTLVIGLRHRLERAVIDDDSRFETIHILRDLQERGCNTDARPRNDPKFPSPGQCSCSFNISTLKRDPLFNDEKTQPMDTSGFFEEDQMADLCSLIPKRTEGQSFASVIRSLFVMKKFHNKNDFVIVGHSHWIQHFFGRKLLAFATDEQARLIGENLKNQKMPNTGIIKFKIIVDKIVDVKADGKPVEKLIMTSSRIDPESPQWVYNPFGLIDDEKTAAWEGEFEGWMNSPESYAPEPDEYV